MQLTITGQGIEQLDIFGALAEAPTPAVAAVPWAPEALLFGDEQLVIGAYAYAGHDAAGLAVFRPVA